MLQRYFSRMLSSCLPTVWQPSSDTAYLRHPHGLLASLGQISRLQAWRACFCLALMLGDGLEDGDASLGAHP